MVKEITSFSPQFNIFKADHNNCLQSLEELWDLISFTHLAEMLYNFFISQNENSGKTSSYKMWKTS